MEILKWAEVSGSSRRSGGLWLICAAVAGFSAVVLAVAVCAKQAVRQAVCESATKNGGKGDSTVRETARLHWPGWRAVKSGVLSVVKNGGAASGGGGGGGGGASAGPQQMYSLIRSKSCCFEAVRTLDLAASKKNAVNQTVIQVGGAPVWQRRILMGERCRLPNFSGLILYDEYGNPLPQYPNRTQT